MILLDAGANVNLTNDRGHTPLHLVAMGRGTLSDNEPQAAQIAQALLEAGAQVNALDPEGHTPFDYTIEEWPSDLSYGLRVVWRNENKPSEIQRVLLRHGAVSSLIDEEGKYPLRHPARTGGVRKGNAGDGQWGRDKG